MVGTKGYRKEEIDKKVQEEQVKIDVIRVFLRANAGLSYTAEAITKETGITCVNDLLYFRHYDYARAVGIKRRAVIEEASGLCSTVQFYHVKEKLLKRLWKRKGAKVKCQ